MNSFKQWLSKLFEGMGYAFVHPIENNMPPDIGTHSYRDKPFKGGKKVWNT